MCLAARMGAALHCIAANERLWVPLYLWRPKDINPPVVKISVGISFA